VPAAAAAGAQKKDGGRGQIKVRHSDVFKQRREVKGVRERKEEAKK
jgi:hypothetical protein